MCQYIRQLPQRHRITLDEAVHDGGQRQFNVLGRLDTRGGLRNGFQKASETAVRAFMPENDGETQSGIFAEFGQIPRQNEFVLAGKEEMLNRLVRRV